MQLTANHDTLVAIRTLVDYVAADEREDYQARLAQAEGDGHVYEAIAQIEKWLSGETEVLYMVASSERASAPPKPTAKS